MKYFTWLAFVCTLYLFSAREAQGCMCEPMHPQVLYCKSDFVVKAYIQGKRDVLMHADGSFDVIDTQRGEEKETNESEGDEPYDGSNEQPEGNVPDDDDTVRPEPLVDGGSKLPIRTPDGDDRRNEVSRPGVASPSEESASSELPDTDESTDGRELVAVVNGQSSEQGSQISLAGAAADHLESPNGLTANGVDTQPATAQKPVVNEPDEGRQIVWPGIVTGSQSRRLGRLNIGTANTFAGDHEDMVVPALRMAGARRPAAYVSGYRGPDGAMPGVQEHFRGIYGKPFGLRAEAGPPAPGNNRGQRPAPLRQRRSAEMREKAVLDGLKVPNGGPRGASENSDKGIRMTQYQVHILKIFKGAVSNETSFIYTPPSSPMCRMDLTLKKPYVILGTIRNSRLHLNHCEYKIDLKTLSTTEAHHLTSNMKHRFRKGCDACQIDICNRPGCETKLPSTNECIWRNMYTLIHPKASQFACLRKKSGVCHWVNALNTTMTPEQLDA